MGELKHLSSPRKRKQPRCPEKWRAKREQPKPFLRKKGRGCRTGIKQTLIT